MFVASSTHVWAIMQLPVSSQIDQLVKDRDFELALQLAVSNSRCFGNEYCITGVDNK